MMLVLSCILKSSKISIHGAKNCLVVVIYIFLFMEKERIVHMFWNFINIPEELLLNELWEIMALKMVRTPIFLLTVRM